MKALLETKAFFGEIFNDQDNKAQEESDFFFKIHSAYSNSGGNTISENIVSGSSDPPCPLSFPN